MLHCEISSSALRMIKKYVYIFKTLQKKTTNKKPTMYLHWKLLEK